MINIPTVRKVTRGIFVKIHDMRVEGVKQYKIAKATGVSQTTVSQVLKVRLWQSYFKRLRKLNAAYRLDALKQRGNRMNRVVYEEQTGSLSIADVLRYVMVTWIFVGTVLIVVRLLL